MSTRQQIVDRANESCLMVHSETGGLTRMLYASTTVDQLHKELWKLDCIIANARQAQQHIQQLIVRS